MLAPDDRGRLLEILEPPAGSVLDAAVAVTYSLDLKALLSIPTAFAFSAGAKDREKDAGLLPLTLLQSLRGNADKITVFCDVTAAHVPTQHQSAVFSFLENCVVPVVAPRGGAFHPKMWAVRFRTADDDLIHRVVVSSRNLTFDRSWDVVAVLEETMTGGVRLSGAVDLLVSLGSGSMLLPGADVRAPVDRAADLAATLSKASFATPGGFDSMALHCLGLSAKQRTRSPLPRDARRALIVSPFLTRGGLENAPGDWDALTLVSRSDQLEAVFPPGAEERELIDARELMQALEDDGDDPISLSGLHAKIWVFDQSGGRSTALVGSANATTAAFASNVELLLELGGRTHSMGVSTWIDGPESMASLLQAHPWADGAPEADATTDMLDELRCDIARASLTGVVEPASDGRYDVRFAFRQPVTVPEGVQVSMRPLSLAAWTRVNGDRLESSFHLDLAAVSAFVAVRVAAPDGEAQFLLKADLEGVPEDRDAKVLAALLANSERLVRFLLLLLADPDDDRFSGEAQQALEHMWRSPHDALPTVPLLEVMARALVRQRSRLDDVDKLMTELGKSDDLTTELFELWESVRVAAGIGGQG
jgi:hypothetical protein